MRKIFYHHLNIYVLYTKKRGEFPSLLRIANYLSASMSMFISSAYTSFWKDSFQLR